MGRRFAPLFLTLSILIFVLAFALLAGRALTIQRKNIDAAEAHYVNFSRKIASSYLAYGSFHSPVFSETVRATLQKEGTLRGIIIYSEMEGIEYLLSLDPGYLTFLPQDYVHTGKAPVYRVSRFTEQVFSTQVTIPGLEGIHLDCIYTVIERNELYPLFRDSLFILGIFFLVTIIFLIASAAKPRTRPAGNKRGGEPRKRSEQVKTASPSHSKQMNTQESGLGWEKMLEKGLGFELRKAASFDQDLVFALMQSRQLKKGGKAHTQTAKLLIECFPFQDLLFEYGINGFAVAVPNVDIDVGIKNFEDFLKKAKSIGLGSPMKIYIGMSSRNGRLMSGRRLIEEAQQALLRAIKNKKTCIMAFRPDPVKYRDYLASKK